MGAPKTLAGNKEESKVNFERNLPRESFSEKMCII